MNLLQFSLPMFYSFQHIGLSTPWLSLFLVFLLFLLFLDFIQDCFVLLPLSDISVLGVKKCNRFLYINLVSCYLAKFIY